VLLTLSCGFCLVGMVMEVFGTAFLIPAAQCEFEMGSAEKGLLNAIGYVGETEFCNCLGQMMKRFFSCIALMSLYAFVSIGSIKMMNAQECNILIELVMLRYPVVVIKMCLNYIHNKKLVCKYYIIYFPCCFLIVRKRKIIRVRVQSN
jgi:hypothetical protein